MRVESVRCLEWLIFTSDQGCRCRPSCCPPGRRRRKWRRGGEHRLRHPPGSACWNRGWANSATNRDETWATRQGKESLMEFGLMWYPFGGFGDGGVQVYLTVMACRAVRREFLTDCGSLAVLLGRGQASPGGFKGSRAEVAGQIPAHGRFPSS